METIARPYARAAFATAQQAQQVQDWFEFFCELERFIRSKQLVDTLKNPTISRKDKMSLFLSLFAKAGGGEQTAGEQTAGEQTAGEQQKTSAATSATSELKQPQKNFLAMVLANRRVEYLPAMKELFNLMKLAAENTINVQVTTAYKLEEKEKSNIAQLIGKLTDKKADIIEEVDASLIGGVIIEWDGKTMDHSIKGKLDKLRTNL